VDKHTVTGRPHRRLPQGCRHQRNGVERRHQRIDLGQPRRLFCDKDGISLRLDPGIAACRLLQVCHCFLVHGGGTLFDKQLHPFVYGYLSLSHDL
jgi:hypothetical protein